MEINGRKTGYGLDPYIVAEIGGAHNGYFDRATTLIDAAKWAGADAVKFQCFTPDTITFCGDRDEFIIKSGPWAGRHLHDLYTETYTPRAWFRGLYDYASDVGITAFSSVFGFDDVDFLQKLGKQPAFKISSFELVDTPLIRYAASTHEPIILSTGMSSHDEIMDAVTSVHSVGNNDVTLLRCVSAYPTSIADSKLSTLMPGDGLSDHSLGVDVAIGAAARGASIIEKHITLNRNGGGPDDAFAMEPSEFKYMVNTVRAISASSFGRGAIKPDAMHSPLRKSLYVIKDMADGDGFTHDNVRSIRPGNGLPPRHMQTVMMKNARGNIKAGTPLSWELLK